MARFWLASVGLPPKFCDRKLVTGNGIISLGWRETRTSETKGNLRSVSRFGLAFPFKVADLRIEAASVGGLFHFKASVQCRLMAHSDQSALRPKWSLTEQSGQRLILARTGNEVNDPTRTSALISI